ncbi:MAG: ribbon-helix-helix domain-containing protein [Promethearchaeota archaeon]
MTHLLDEYEQKSRFKKEFEDDKMTMKNITINIPIQYDMVIQKLIDKEIISNRSEAIRTALREFLSKEFTNIELMDDFLNERVE